MSQSNTSNDYSEQIIRALNEGGGWDGDATGNGGGWWTGDWANWAETDGRSESGQNVASGDVLGARDDGEARVECGGMEMSIFEREDWFEALMGTGGTVAGNGTFEAGGGGSGGRNEGIVPTSLAPDTDPAKTRVLSMRTPNAYPPNPSHPSKPARISNAQELPPLLEYTYASSKIGPTQFHQPQQQSEQSAAGLNARAGGAIGYLDYTFTPGEIPGGTSFASPIEASSIASGSNLLSPASVSSNAARRQHSVKRNRACNRCKQQKRRCDENTACKNCIEAGVPCTRPLVGVQRGSQEMTLAPRLAGRGPSTADQDPAFQDLSRQSTTGSDASRQAAPTGASQAAGSIVEVQQDYPVQVALTIKVQGSSAPVPLGAMYTVRMQDLPQIQNAIAAAIASLGSRAEQA